jgi:hypothetical protein
MAGGSLPNVSLESKSFLQDAVSMKIAPALGNSSGKMLSSSQSYIIYNPTGQISLDLSSSKGTYKVFHINPQTGKQSLVQETVKGGSTISLKNSSSNPEVLWLKKI